MDLVIKLGCKTTTICIQTKSVLFCGLQGLLYRISCKSIKESLFLVRQVQFLYNRAYTGYPVTGYYLYGNNTCSIRKFYLSKINNFNTTLKSVFFFPCCVFLFKYLGMLLYNPKHNNFPFFRYVSRRCSALDVKL